MGKRHELLYLGRILFAGLFIFEFLNWVGLLHFSLEFTWLGLLLTSGAVWLACEMITKEFHHNELPPRSQGLAFMGAAIPIYADALGDINRWYGAISHYDKYLHFLGGAAAAGLVLLVIYTYAKRKKASFTISENWVAWISFLIATALGVLYEFEEYLEDYFTGSHRSGGGPDTAGDLLFDTFGAILVIVTVWLVWKAKKKKI
jgi:hypothetical protein